MVLDRDADVVVHESDSDGRRPRCVTNGVGEDLRRHEPGNVAPLLRPTLVTVLILSFLGKMNAFNVVWVLTNGGPMHYSETVATYMQKRAFAWNSLDLGYPAAIGVVWFGVIVVGVGLISRWLRRQIDV